MKNFKFDRSEFTGAFGDLGTLLPLSIALIAVNGLDPVRVFAFVGLFCIITGVFYKVPMPIQPLKAVAVIAISLGLPREMIFASGIIIGCIVLLTSITGIIRHFSRIFSDAVVRGIQITVGFLLALEGMKFILYPAFFHDWSLSAIIPAGSISAQSSPFMFPTASDFITAFFLLVIPQLPVTFGNAVFASGSLAKKYYGSRADKVTPRALAATIGVLNIIAGLVCAMPVCHGSGGVAAHHKFGARTGGAPIILGTTLLLSCIVFRGSIAGILSFVPLPLLGILLTASGIGMIRLIFDFGGSWREKVVASSVALVALFTHSLTAGLCAGLAANLALQRVRTS